MSSEREPTGGADPAPVPGEPAQKGESESDTAGPERKGGRPPGVEELGGPKGPEPTRYGDWEKGGRCSDF
jgi:hypothetical protein